MILILLFGSLLYLSHSLDLPVLLTEHSLFLHRICLRSVPALLENRESLEALVCGKNIDDLEVKQLLIDTSLIHIFVVSGSHFLLLRNFFARLVGKTPWLLIPLFIYAMVTLCQPPSLRALAFIGLQEIALRRKLFLSNLQLVFLSALLCVAFFPQWILSRSLLMSLMAATAMTTAEEIFDRKMAPGIRSFLSQSFMFFAMSFCLWGLSTLHPLSILMNVILGPLIGTVLFPVGVLAIILPFTAPLFDRCMNCLLWLLQKSDVLLRASPDATPLNIFSQWVLILALLLIAHRWAVRTRRARYET
ncbi:MAG: ComEC/Rec2 family competence protein [Bdellovibrionaceae bacterium]|nr:ComEC/Rec2 family competence protein [Pseudobdellovibrionaceae bacterium]